MMKTYLYNKVKETGKRAVLSLLAPALLTVSLTSCVDTIILPDDKTVDEDFWKTKEDVSSMVNAAYAAMASNDVLARLVVWGDFRTDEVNMVEGVDVSTETQALEEIAAVNMQTTNIYATWASIYNVINRCNIVLDRAEEVMTIDPNYTSGDYLTDRSQMLALRALCYYYLVRVYHDVPYIDKAYMNSSQNTQVSQSAPAEVLAKCIADLEEALENPLRARGYGLNDWRRVGWMTEDGICALLADIYLWRASVMHSDADYQACVNYCNRVIESKTETHIGATVDGYPLAEAEDMYTKLFVDQNAEESIFEIQSRSNLPLCQYYYKYKKANGDGGEGWLKATTYFGGSATTYNNVNTMMSVTTLYADIDLRKYAACFMPTTGEVAYDIRKMISTNDVRRKEYVKKREAYDYGGMDRNYNVYRLSDVMLMKAEALVQLVDTTMEGLSDAEKLDKTETMKAAFEEAFNLVAAVNTRAIFQDDKNQAIKWATFANFTKDQFEKMVMIERMREFCFEGRRWYDLMRYNYRHMENVDYTRTLYEQGADALPKNYDDMLDMMTSRRGADASGVKAKMANEGFLYMPVPNSELIVCPLLHQNPVYGDTNQYEKNY